MSTKVLYICGYGRSGSTIIESMLSTYLDFCPLGEVINITKAPKAGVDRQCSCGSGVDECSTWGEISNAIRCDRLSSGHTRSSWRLLRARYSASLYNSYSQVTGEHRTLIDASKTSFDAFATAIEMAKKKPDAYFIHVIRSPVRVLDSRYSHNNVHLKKGITQRRRGVGIKTTFGWIFSNLVALHIGRIVGTRRYIIIDYENFCRDPRKCLVKIAELVEDAVFTEEPPAKSINKFHSVAGNYLSGTKRDEITIDQVVSYNKKMLPQASKAFLRNMYALPMVSLYSFMIKRSAT